MNFLNLMEKTFFYVSLVLYSGHYEFEANFHYCFEKEFQSLRTGFLGLKPECKCQFVQKAVKAQNTEFLVP